MMEMVVIVTTFILKDNDVGHWSMTKQYKRLSVRVSEGDDDTEDIDNAFFAQRSI